MPIETYTPEAITARKARLRAELALRKEGIRQQVDAIRKPGLADSKADLWWNRVNSALALADGIMTGYKLVRATSAKLRRKRT